MFGDVDGEMLYMMIREARPKVVFEISPWNGWSTNYILAALTANEDGTLHSFELDETIRGHPTEEVVRGNQFPDGDQNRLVLHIGDARGCVKDVEGNVNFLLIDSCHEDYFAQWYIDQLFPRVSGTIFIQDIVFTDHLEPSTEATYVWEWLKKENIKPFMIGTAEAEIRKTDLRNGFGERQLIRSNSIILRQPFERGAAVKLAVSPKSHIRSASRVAREGEISLADQKLNKAVQILLENSWRVNRHREFIRAGKVYATMGEKGEAQRCYRRALGVSVGLDNQSHPKVFSELSIEFIKCRQWKLFVQLMAIALFEPRTWSMVMRKLMLLVLNRLRIVRL